MNKIFLVTLFFTFFHLLMDLGDDFVAGDLISAKNLMKSLEN